MMVESSGFRLFTRKLPLLLGFAVVVLLHTLLSIGHALC
jgi:hypothetical protein